MKRKPPPLALVPKSALRRPWVQLPLSLPIPAQSNPLLQNLPALVGGPHSGGGEAARGMGCNPMDSCREGYPTSKSQRKFP